MDLLELRILAAGGILAIGLALSALAVAAVTIGGWLGRARHARVGTSARASVAGRETSLAAGRAARC
jgi:hypothetical protein